MFSRIRAVTDGSVADCHIQDDVLERYALGRITEGGQVGAVEEHLLVCAGCRDRLRGQDEFARVVRAALRRGGTNSFW
jgi:hypothetical protein